MKKQNIFYTIVVVCYIFTTGACNSNKDKSDTLMNKPYLNHKLSFSIFDKDISKSFTPLKDLPTKDLLSIIDSLSADLKTRDANYVDKYFNWYDLYTQSLDFKVFFHAKQSDAAKNLDLLKINLEKGNRDIDLSVLQQMFVYYKYGSEFKHDWFLKPDISFSVDFYNKFIQGPYREILFNSYQYDGTHDSKFLQVFKPLANSDPYAIQPHYVDKNTAKLFLNNIQTTSDSSVLGTESKVFKTLMEKVTKDEIKLIVNNNDF